MGINNTKLMVAVTSGEQEAEYKRERVTKGGFKGPENEILF